MKTREQMQTASFEQAYGTPDPAPTKLDRSHPDFFKQIGAKGGAATKDKYGPEYFSAIGRKGGETMVRERGIEFFAAIGRIGGPRSKGVAKTKRTGTTRKGA